MTYDNEEIISYLQDCYDEHGKVTIRLFRDFDGPSSGTVVNHFGTFNNALEEAGLPKTDTWENYTRDELLEQVKTVAKQNNSIRPKYFGGEFADRGQIDKEFGSIGKAAGIAECHEFLPDYFECKDCGGLFQQVSLHIGTSSCNYPNISEYEKEMYKGILLGDGSIGARDNTPFFSVSMSGESGEKFINWLQTQVTIPAKVTTRKLDNDNHRDVHILRTQAHNFFYNLSNWYDTGRKEYPTNLSLTPTILKMWYVSDGSMSNGGPIFTCWNESNRSEFLLSLFEDIGLSVTWQDGNNDIYIQENSQDDFFEYIGSPPPGFEYKWP